MTTPIDALIPAIEKDWASRTYKKMDGQKLQISPSQMSFPSKKYRSISFHQRKDYRIFSRDVVK